MVETKTLSRVYVKHYILLIVMCGLVGMPLVWSVPQDLVEPFVGTDSQAVALITTLAPDYQPWVETLWRPPGPAVESFFFALQAALGAGMVGYYLGRRHSDVHSHWAVSLGHEALFPSDKGPTDAPG